MDERFTRIQSKRWLGDYCCECRSGKKLADAFLAEFSPGFKIVFDPSGKFATDFKVAGMPSAYIIDRDGKPRFKHIGFHLEKREQYEQEIQSLLDESAH